ncbi:hypothetical protein CISIN_1g043174mg [Citrus sinensis]|uniref:non-specific serine/threonine protein kinase n=1 Tax=Citrus sinensis TaxID=2711 RepID=A0A067ENU1_CITSI|nr:hypothetical protein CISIN_1g043174mg [Citrus sinensis]
MVRLYHDLKCYDYKPYLISSLSFNSHSSASSCSSRNERHLISSYFHHTPHKTNQPAKRAMNKLLQQEHGQVGLDQFQLFRRLGSGIIRSVYIKKRNRVHIEKEILKMLDHPFLPSLFAEFEASHYSRLVIEYCPGGDLLTVSQRQRRLRFSIPSAN